MFCQKCGTEIPDGVQNCPKCSGQMMNNNPQINQAQPYGYQNKSKMVAGLLGIFLGTFGVHNFYLGYTTKGVIQLCITLLTCGIGAIVSCIWGIVEGVLILCGSINVDAKGMPLIDGTSTPVVNQYYNSTINNYQSYQNAFKVSIKEIKNEDNMTVIIGDVESGSISVGDTARIENTETHEFISCRIANIIEDDMNVSFSMAKNVIIKIPQIDISNVGNELIK